MSNPPRDPVTGQFVSRRRRVYTMRRWHGFPFFWTGVIWVVLCGWMGVGYATATIIITFLTVLVYGTIRDLAASSSHHRDVRAMAEAELMQKYIRAGHTRAEALGLVRSGKSDHDMTDAEVATRKRAATLIDEFGYCLVCGALAELHVDKYGAYMKPSDFHLSLDDPRWDDVQSIVELHAPSAAPDTPSPATRRALSASQEPQLWSEVAHITPEDEAVALGQRESLTEEK